MKQDKISGAAEIETKAMDYISKYLGKKELFEKCFIMLSLYPSMASIWNIANFAFLYGKEAKEKFEEMKKANEKVVEHGKKVIRDGYTILTYSRSSTVAKILKACKNKDIKIICSESRPKYEGRKLAKELCNQFEVVLTTDAALFSFLDEADVVITGADAILSDGIVNKVGTSALALYAKERKKPIYVASSSYKTFPFVFIKEEDGKEIWKNAPEEIKLRNFYFDLTPSRYISHFITEKGVSKTKPQFKYEVAEEIMKIRNLLADKFHLVR